MHTRQPPKAGERWNTCVPLRTVSTEISVAKFFVLGRHSRRIREKSGCETASISRAARNDSNRR